VARQDNLGRAFFGWQHKREGMSKDFFGLGVFLLKAEADKLLIEGGGGDRKSTYEPRKLTGKVDRKSGSLQVAEPCVIPKSWSVC
jgi:hypothetical protein